MYRLLFSYVLSRLDAERAHTLAVGVIRALPVVGLGALVRRVTRPDASLRVTTLGLDFESPFGVAAGLGVQFVSDDNVVISLEGRIHEAMRSGDAPLLFMDARVGLMFLL